jgi:hypothetical protein
MNTADGLAFVSPKEGLWPVDRYLSLILGEVPRLRDDAQGYGPAGRDFIVHVDFPRRLRKHGRFFSPMRCFTKRCAGVRWFKRCPFASTLAQTGNQCWFDVIPLLRLCFSFMS